MKKVSVTKDDVRHLALNFWKWFLLPSLIFAAIFFITQPHYLTNFSKGFFLDNGDGYQNVWNIWWVKDAIIDKGTTPYFTTMLHWPHGVSLVPQTMNIFNGLIGIPLQTVFGMSLIEAVNFAVVFSFVMSGVTMFWFIQKLYKTYWVSIIAGCLYTFSTFHFAHGLGHLQLVSFEWIPLFLLAFWNLVEKVRYRNAALAAGALFLVLTTDYYYLIWCVFLGAAWFAWNVYTKKLKLSKQNLKVFAAFACLSVALIGPLMFQLWKMSQHGNLLGGHDATAFGLDPVAVFLPGGSWHWGQLTRGYWEHLAYTAEASVYFGVGLLSLLAIALVSHKRLKAPKWLWFWWIILLAFGVLALGPRLTTLQGRTLEEVPMPYALLEKVMPSLKISGMPIRWILVSLIAAIVIASFVLSKINLNKTYGKVLLGAFIVVTVIDLFPFRLPLTVPRQEPYIAFLKNQPRGAIIDNAALTGPDQLYHQTEHEYPIAFGYTTRVTKDTDQKDFLIFAALEQGRLADLCKVYKVRYVTLPPSRPLNSDVYPVIYRDPSTLIYDMKNSEDC